MTGPWGCGDQVAWRPLAAGAAAEVLCQAATRKLLELSRFGVGPRPWRQPRPCGLAPPITWFPPPGWATPRDGQPGPAPSLAPTSPAPARLAAPGCVPLKSRVVRVHARAAPGIGPHLRPPLLASQGPRTVSSLYQAPGRPHRSCLLLAPQAGAQWGAAGLLLHLLLANF